MPAYGVQFSERLAMSQGVSVSASIGEIILQNVPGAVNVESANGTDDRQGTDWWVTMLSGNKLSVDVKVREVDYKRKTNEDDLALETWSVVEKKICGWTRNAHKRTDYILWVWQDTGRWCLVPFQMLCRVMNDHWQEWSSVCRKAQQYTVQSSGGYHSECIFVPRVEVWRAIYKRFGGDSVVACPASFERF